MAKDWLENINALAEVEKWDDRMLVEQLLVVLSALNLGPKVERGLKALADHERLPDEYDTAFEAIQRAVRK